MVHCDIGQRPKLLCAGLGGGGDLLGYEAQEAVRRLIRDVEASAGQEELGSRQQGPPQKPAACRALALMAALAAAASWLAGFVFFCRGRLCSGVVSEPWR